MPEDWAATPDLIETSDSWSPQLLASAKRAIERAASWMSRRYLLALGRIQGRPGHFDCLCEVGIAKRLIDHEVNGAIEDSDKSCL